MNTRNLIWKTARLLLAGALLWFPFVEAQAAITTVCASGCDFSEVQPAIDAAQPGDTVQIGSGTYPVNLSINKNLILQGQGANQTILDGSQKGSVISINETGDVQLSGLTIKNGLTQSPKNGGGIFNLGKLNITKCVITDNKANAPYFSYIINGGGGIHNQGDLDIKYTTISSNSTDTYGGAIYNIGKNVRIAYSSIVNNRSPSTTEGGIHNEAVSGSNLFILQSTISGNTGIALSDKNGSNIILNNVTVNSKSTVDSSLIFGSNLHHAIIYNSIIVSPIGTPNCKYTGSSASTLKSAGGNVTSDASCQLNDPTDQPNSGHINLGPLQINAPGITPTHALLSGSSAIDRVLSSGLSPCLASFQLQDQRGVSRPQGAGCDSGAFELRAPVTNDDHFIATPGQAITIPHTALLLNDQSPDRLAEGNILALDGVTGTKNGTLNDLSRTKSLQYIPKMGFNGQDSFTYTVSDGIHTSEPATVIIDVQPANRPPVAVDDSYSGYADHPLAVTALLGILANDSDPDGNTLTAAIVGLPAHGALVTSPNGLFSYTPEAGFTGTDNFTYKVSDGQSYSNVATVMIKVNAATSTITIMEDAQPDNPANFSFSGDLGNFILDNPKADDGDLYGNSKTIEVAPGTYTISQIRGRAWFTGSITCNPLGNTAIDTVADTLQVTIGFGENKTCTFVNQPYGGVKVKVFYDLNKDRSFTSNEPGILNWKMMLLNPATGKWVSKLTNSNGDAVFANLKPNVYTVCEVLQTGWKNTVPAVIDPVYHKSCRKVTVTAGQTAPALFGNSQ
jgi:hypothetical protein